MLNAEGGSTAWEDISLTTVRKLPRASVSVFGQARRRRAQDASPDRAAGLAARREPTGQGRFSHPGALHERLRR